MEDWSVHTALPLYMSEELTDKTQQASSHPPLSPMPVAELASQAPPLLRSFLGLYCKPSWDPHAGQAKGAFYWCLLQSQVIETQETKKGTEKRQECGDHVCKL